MSCLQGYVTATYDQLVEVFGIPDYMDPSGDGKIDTEWEVFNTPAGTVRIYDWKEYDGGRRSRDGNPYEWHIGGTTRKAVHFVIEKLAEA